MSKSRKPGKAKKNRTNTVKRLRVLQANEKLLSRLKAKQL
jgi:hypothetical protein